MRQTAATELNKAATRLAELMRDSEWHTSTAICRATQPWVSGATVKTLLDSMGTETRTVRPSDRLGRPRREYRLAVPRD